MPEDQETIPAELDPSGPLGDVYRREAGKILASLVRSGLSLDLAEDALHDACAQALSAWRDRGSPHNPAAWLLTVSRRRAIDRLRRLQTQERKVDELKVVVEALAQAPVIEDDSLILDERLSLIFACCHPDLTPETRTALTLRSVCGLTIKEIARAFLVNEKTMGQRVVRAKNTIRERRIPFEVPDRRQLDTRLGSVLDVVYLIFNEGHAATSGPNLARGELILEAIRLGELLFNLLERQSAHPEVGGLLALMLLHESRRGARVDQEGRYVPVEQQDRSLWNAEMIKKGVALTLSCLAKARPGRFQIQAAIAALHCEAPSHEETDWAQIACLYEVLSVLDPSPVVTVNRALAVAAAVSPEKGLEILLSVKDRLPNYQPYQAARADLLLRCNRFEEARTAYDAAVGLSTNPVEKSFLIRRRSTLDG